MTRKSLETSLQERPPIHPLRATLKDSAFLFGGVGTLQASMSILSGFKERNLFRLIYGIIDTTNALVLGSLSFYGRYQTLRDMRDLQAGMKSDAIVQRAKDAEQNSALRRFFNKAAANTFDTYSKVSIGVVSGMAISGISSGNLGETITGLSGVLVHALALGKEQHRSAPAAATESPPENPSFLRKLFNRMAHPFKKMQPMTVSSLVSFARQMPLGISAALRGDFAQMAYVAGGIPMNLLKMDTTKAAIGPGDDPGGSHLFARAPSESGRISSIILDGNLRKPTKNLLKKAAHFFQHQSPPSLHSLLLSPSPSDMDMRNPRHRENPEIRNH